MKKYRSRGDAFSIASSIYLLLFLVLLNTVHRSYPWVIYCIPAFVIYPLAVCRPHLLGNKVFAFGLSVGIVAYYTTLNILVAPGHPWALYIAFAVMWYPFAIIFAKRSAFVFAVFGLVWSLLFFGTINLITTPSTIWAIYPIFAVLWWPLSVYFFVQKGSGQSA